MKPEISLEDHFYGTATVGERGQVVIPADARKKHDISAGDKVLVLSHPGGHGILLCKIDAMKDVFSTFLKELELIESRVANEDNANGE